MPDDIQNLLKSHFIVTEQKSDHYFRTEIPNIVFEMDLDCFEFKLYAYIKKIAGDSGGCWKSKPNIEAESFISKRKIDLALEVLAKPQELLNGHSLIKIIPRQDQPSLLIINDIWRINGDVMREKCKEKFRGAGDAPGGVHGMQGGGAGDAPKEDPFINSDCVDSDVASDKLKIFDSSQRMSEITISDLHFICSKFRYDWSTSEIKYLWERLCKHRGCISDVGKFSDAIIKKERIVQKVKNNQSGKKCQKKNNTPNKKSPNTTDSKNNSQEKNISENINPSTSGEDMKTRPFANWREMFGL